MTNDELLAVLESERRTATDWARSEHGLTLTCEMVNEAPTYVKITFQASGKGVSRGCLLYVGGTRFIWETEASARWDFRNVAKRLVLQVAEEAKEAGQS